MTVAGWEFTAVGRRETAEIFHPTTENSHATAVSSGQIVDGREFPVVWREFSVIFRRETVEPWEFTTVWRRPWTGFSAGSAGLALLFAPPR